MTDIFFGFGGTEAQAKAAGGGRATNVLREFIDKKTNAIYPRPGLAFETDVAALPCRGVGHYGVYVYSVHGSAIYRTSESGETDRLGDIQTHAGRCYMAFNGVAVGVVDGTAFYSVDAETGAITTPTLPAGVKPSHIAYSQGFFYINDTPTGDVYHHQNSYDTSTWNSLDQSNAEYSPDELLAIFDVSDNIIMCGSKTVEVWTYTGNLYFVIQPILGLNYEFGIAAVDSFAKMTDSAFFLARDAGGGLQAVMLSRGTQISVIGEPLIIAEWSTYATVSDAHGAAVSIGGHPLYLLTFPSEDKTWVYDASIKAGSKWCEWESYDRFSDQRGRFKGDYFVTVNNRQFCLTYDDGSMYEIDRSIRSDQGEPIVMSVDSNEISNKGKYSRHNAVKVMMNTGEGLSNQALQGHDPMIRLGYTDDHGNTWKWRDWLSFGKQGEYDKEVVFRSLGRSRHRKYRLQVSDPVHYAIANPCQVMLDDET